MAASHVSKLHDEKYIVYIRRMILLFCRSRPATPFDRQPSLSVPFLAMSSEAGGTKPRQPRRLPVLEKQYA